MEWCFRVVLQNPWVMTSISGVSVLELQSSGTKPVTFLVAQSSLGGHKQWFGGAQAVICGGTIPECPPWRRACVTIEMITVRFTNQF